MNTVGLVLSCHSVLLLSCHGCLRGSAVTFTLFYLYKNIYYIYIVGVLSSDDVLL